MEKKIFMNNEKQNIYLIVGANGFIGSYMIKNIIEKTDKKILAVDCNIEGKENTSRLEWLECDITKQSDIEKLNIKCKEYGKVKVLYLAAYHAPDLVKKNPRKAWNINVTSLSSFVNSIENVECFFYSSTEMVYGAGEKNKKFSEEKHADPSKLHFSKIAYGVPFAVGDIEFTAFEADHIKGEECCIFALSDGTHSFLYGNDTGLPPERTFDALNRYGKVFSAISLDCARGTLPGDAHMGLAEDKTVCERLRSCGLIDASTKIYLNHFSHMCGLAPDEFASLAEKDDMYLTHDGMVVTV